MNLLEVRNLNVSILDKEILRGLNLEIKKGEVHVIMGPNGSGKSTLAAAIVGNPIFDVDAGQIIYEGEDIVELEVDERARRGLFLSFQIPEEIEGLEIEEFLRTAKEARTGEKIGAFKFHTELVSKMKSLQIPEEVCSRHLNVGFSGGEKKKSEILQLSVLEPKLAILDETDSGLDVDASKTVFEGVSKIKEANPDMALLIITHYNKVVDYVKPDFVHVLYKGKIVKTGGVEITQHIEDNGYEDIKAEYDSVINAGGE